MRAALEDYYAVLGVSQRATAPELRRAYRILALRHHPDRAGASSTELFQKISVAYRVLVDPGARATYDQTCRPAPPAGPPPEGGPANAGLYTGPGGQFGWQAPRRAGAPAGPWLERLSGPLEILVARRVARHGADGTVELLLEADEARAGGVAVIETAVTITCPTCAGVAAQHRVWCRRCQYLGNVRDEVSVHVTIPALVTDGWMLSFPVDPAGLCSPWRVRLRVTPALDPRAA